MKLRISLAPDPNGLRSWWGMDAQAAVRVAVLLDDVVIVERSWGLGTGRFEPTPETIRMWLGSALYYAERFHSVRHRAMVAELYEALR